MPLVSHTFKCSDFSISWCELNGITSTEYRKQSLTHVYTKHISAREKLSPCKGGCTLVLRDWRRIGPQGVCSHSTIHSYPPSTVLHTSHCNSTYTVLHWCHRLPLATFLTLTPPPLENISKYCLDKWYPSNTQLTVIPTVYMCR